MKKKSFAKMVLPIAFYLFITNQTVTPPPKILADTISQDVSVTIPSEVDVGFTADGSSVASNFTVENHSQVPIQLNGFNTTMQNNWNLSDGTKFNKNQKAFHLRLNNQIIRNGPNSLNTNVLENSNQTFRLGFSHGVYTQSMINQTAMTIETTYTIGKKDFSLELRDADGNVLQTLTGKNGDTIVLPNLTNSVGQQVESYTSTKTGQTYYPGNDYTIPIGGDSFTITWKTGYVINSTAGWLIHLPQLFDKPGYTVDYYTTSDSAGDNHYEGYSFKPFDTIQIPDNGVLTVTPHYRALLPHEHALDYNFQDGHGYFSHSNIAWIQDEIPRTYFDNNPVFTVPALPPGPESFAGVIATSKSDPNLRDTQGIIPDLTIDLTAFVQQNKTDDVLLTIDRFFVNKPTEVLGWEYAGIGSSHLYGYTFISQYIKYSSNFFEEDLNGLKTEFNLAPNVPNEYDLSNNIGGNELLHYSLNGGHLRFSFDMPRLIDTGFYITNYYKGSQTYYLLWTLGKSGTISPGGSATGISYPELFYNVKLPIPIRQKWSFYKWYVREGGRDFNVPVGKDKEFVDLHGLKLNDLANLNDDLIAAYERSINLRYIDRETGEVVANKPVTILDTGSWKDRSYYDVRPDFNVYKGDKRVSYLGMTVDGQSSIAYRKPSFGSKDTFPIPKAMWEADNIDVRVSWERKAKADVYAYIDGEEYGLIKSIFYENNESVRPDSNTLMSYMREKYKGDLLFDKVDYGSVGNDNYQTIKVYFNKPVYIKGIDDDGSELFNIKYGTKSKLGSSVLLPFIKKEDKVIDYYQLKYPDGSLDSNRKWRPYMDPFDTNNSNYGSSTFTFVPVWKPITTKRLTLKLQPSYKWLESITQAKLARNGYTDDAVYTTLSDYNEAFSRTRYTTNHPVYGPTYSHLVTQNANGQRLIHIYNPTSNTLRYIYENEPLPEGYMFFYDMSYRNYQLLNDQIIFSSDVANIRMQYIYDASNLNAYANEWRLINDQTGASKVVSGDIDTSDALNYTSIEPIFRESGIPKYKIVYELQDKKYGYLKIVSTLDEANDLVANEPDKWIYNGAKGINVSTKIKQYKEQYGTGVRDVYSDREDDLKYWDYVKTYDF